MQLKIAYQDEDLVVIDKPKGMLVHPVPNEPDNKQVAMKLLRDQLGQKVYPLHRLDRPTSGLLLFALTKQCNQLLRQAFDQQQIKKQYLSYVIGHSQAHWHSKKPLLKDPFSKTLSTQLPQSAHTEFRCLQQIMLALPNQDSVPISLIQALPFSGRYHQIRRHLAASGHPIIGDYLHGDIDFNQQVAAQYGIKRLMLLAEQLSFIHPITGCPLSITAPLPVDFKALKAL